jgi:hypothetical protein
MIWSDNDTLSRNKRHLIKHTYTSGQDNDYKYIQTQYTK